MITSKTRAPFACSSLTKFNTPLEEGLYQYNHQEEKAGRSLGHSLLLIIILLVALILHVCHLLLMVHLRVFIYSFAFSRTLNYIFII